VELFWSACPSTIWQWASKSFAMWQTIWTSKCFLQKTVKINSWAIIQNTSIIANLDVSTAVLHTTRISWNSTTWRCDSSFRRFEVSWCLRLQCHAVQAKELLAECHRVISQKTCAFRTILLEDNLTQLYVTFQFGEADYIQRIPREM